MKKLFSYKGQKVYLEKTTYQNNNSLAVIMYTADDELFDVITVNLNNSLQSDSMAFLDTNHQPEIEKFIRKYKLGLPMYYQQQSGFNTYPLYTLFTEQF